MTDAQTHLTTADSLLSKIYVSGDNVMLLATARQEIKAAFDALKEDVKDA